MPADGELREILQVVKILQKKDDLMSIINSDLKRTNIFEKSLEQLPEYNKPQHREGKNNWPGVSCPYVAANFWVTIRLFSNDE